MRENLLFTLKKEFEVLKDISDRQFEQRFSTNKYKDSWQDDLFKEYQECRIRIDLLLKLLK